MKYENFKKAKSAVEEIDKSKSILADLQSEGIYVKIMNGGSTIMSLDADPSSSEHEFKSNAISFIDQLKLHYKQKIIKLTAELEEL